MNSKLDVHLQSVQENGTINTMNAEINVMLNDSFSQQGNKTKNTAVK